MTFNINQSRDDGKAKVRESTNFNDISTTQTDMGVSINTFDDNFQHIFHNWKDNDPETCNQNRKKDPCRVCVELETKGKVTRKADGAIHYLRNDNKNQLLNNE